jgi:hypothetical protein
MTEYIIMVILIALAVLIFTQFLGQTVGTRRTLRVRRSGGLTIP